MWQEQKVKEPKKKTIELDSKLTDAIQKSMFGGLRADGGKEDNTKKIMMGGVIGVFVGLYFGRSPYIFGVSGIVISSLIFKNK